MSRKKQETTLLIESIIVKQPEITYNQAVDQGLINPEIVDVGRFNVTKSNFKKLQHEDQKAVKTQTVSKPKRKVKNMAQVSEIGDLTTAMKLIADAGGLNKAKELIARLTDLQKAVLTIENAKDSLAKIA